MTKTYKLPKVLVLDYRKWRCGGDYHNSEFSHGVGTTLLENEEGYMCCLGQFCKQAGLKKNELLDVDTPSSLPNVVLGLVKYGTDNGFSNTAIAINDDESSTIAWKVRKLQTLCRKYRRELVLKNFPKAILEKVANAR